MAWRFVVGRLTAVARDLVCLEVMVVLAVHPVPFKLNIDHLTNGVKQLHAVVKKVEVLLVMLFDVAVVLPFHAFRILNSCRNIAIRF